MPITPPDLIMASNLRRSNHIAKRLDRPRLQQRQPVHAPRIRVERGRVQQDLRAQALVVQRELGEAQVEADGRADFACWCLEGQRQGGAALDAGGLAHCRAVGDGDVEEVDFLVAVCDFAARGDPEEGVFELVRGGGGGFVDADGDGEGVGCGEGLEAEDEGGGAGGLAEGEGFGGVVGEVVGCFGKEDGLEVMGLVRMCCGFGLVAL